MSCCAVLCVCCALMFLLLVQQRNAACADTQAAVEVGAEEAARLSELSKALSKETAALAKLRASCDGLQKKAAALQVCLFVRVHRFF